MHERVAPAFAATENVAAKERFKKKYQSDAGGWPHFPGVRQVKAEKLREADPVWRSRNGVFVSNLTRRLAVSSTSRCP